MTWSRSARRVRRSSRSASTCAARGAGLPAGLDDPSLLRNLEVEITDVQLEYPTGQHHMRPGDPLVIRMGFDAVHATDNVVFAINVFDQRGNQLLATNTDLEGIDVGHLDGAGELVFRIGGVPLMDGVYEIHFGVHTHDISRVYDHRGGEGLHRGHELGQAARPRVLPAGDRDRHDGPDRAPERAARRSLTWRTWVCAHRFAVSESTHPNRCSVKPSGRSTGSIVGVVSG